MERKRHILVTGGDGFLGRALTNRLLELGHRVTVVDDHSTSQAGPQSAHRRVVEEDVCEVDLNALGGVDGVLHLASPAAPSLFGDMPLQVLRPNVTGTERLLALARSNSCRMLYFSSSEVYGSGCRMPNSTPAYGESRQASHRLLTDRSCYGAAKRMGEELVRAWRHEFGVDACSIRPFNVYGPGMDPTLPGYGRVIPNFTRAAEARDPLMIHGDGRQVRSFLWIDDLVNAVVEIFHHPGDLPLAVNVGHDEPVSVNELATMFESIIGQPLKRAHSERDPDDVLWRRPDTSLLRELTGWTPTVSLEDGLRALIDGREAARCGS